MNYKIDFKIAEEEFYKICESWEIDTDTKGMTSDEIVDFNGLKRKIIKAIRLGRLSFNEDETMTYIVSQYSSDDLSGEELIVKRPKGSDYTGMDQFKEGKDMHKTYSLLAGMIGKPIQFLNKLDGLDLKPLLAISTLFLAD
jgi:hypothetical protein